MDCYLVHILVLFGKVPMDRGPPLSVRLGSGSTSSDSSSSWDLQAIIDQEMQLATAGNLHRALPSPSKKPKKPHFAAAAKKKLFRSSSMGRFQGNISNLRSHNAEFVSCEKTSLSHHHQPDDNLVWLPAASPTIPMTPPPVALERRPGAVLPLQRRCFSVEPRSGGTFSNGGGRLPPIRDNVQLDFSGV